MGDSVADVSSVAVRQLPMRVNLRTRLACIAHKSLEVCERCRLWQRNSPAMPENSAAFWREEFKSSLFRFIYFKTGS
jgi:hypothetical protein